MVAQAVNRLTVARLACTHNALKSRLMLSGDGIVPERVAIPQQRRACAPGLRECHGPRLRVARHRFEPPQ